MPRQQSLHKAIVVETQAILQDRVVIAAKENFMSMPGSKLGQKFIAHLREPFCYINFLDGVVFEIKEQKRGVAGRSMEVEQRLSILIFDNRLDELPLGGTNRNRSLSRRLDAEDALSA